MSADEYEKTAIFTTGSFDRQSSSEKPVSGSMTGTKTGLHKAALSAGLVRFHLDPRHNGQKSANSESDNVTRGEIHESKAASTSKYGSSSFSDSVASKTKFLCNFEQSRTVGPVIVYSARPKNAERIREKLVEYRAEGAEWPYTACILDAVRASVVCSGPAHMLEVANWFTSCAYSGESPPKLVPCRVKNKFILQRAETVLLSLQ